ncbi:EsaB/YukD family protein [Yinghuangia sp. YIM S09857]|uniref:EsaB/YukD family protein n=1 Tax=Yinghuangia sp. YIM S09857 TaxID=3436929 RepID=UPI003F533D84
MTTTMRSTDVRLSRVTVVGERRRIDLLLPSREPVGALLPDLIRMLEEPSAPTPELRRLVTGRGVVLAPDDSLASADVADGAVLRLVHRRETPAAPVVHDVTDEAADDLDRRQWRWNDGVRDWTAGTATIVLALVTAFLARDWLGTEKVAGWLVGVAVGTAALGATAARWGNRPLGGVLVLLGGATGAVGAWSMTTDSDRMRLAALGLTAVAVCLLAAVCTPIGRGGLVGGGVVAALVGGWELGLALTDHPHRAAVAVGTLSVVALGVLPRYALMAAGLTRLDDRRSGDFAVSRHQVDSALTATHRGLALATVAMSASVGVAGWIALTDVNRWTVATAVLLTVVVLCRSRAYPLAVEVAAMLAAGAVLAVRLVVLWADQPDEPAVRPLAALCVLTLLPLAAFVVRPPDHVRVRLRRVLDAVESVGVIALIPVCFGAFGVYGRLLDTF